MYYSIYILHCTFTHCSVAHYITISKYHIYPKYWDSFTIFLLKFKKKCILLPVDVSKIVLDEQQTVRP